MKEIKFKYVLDGKEIDKEFIDWNRNPSVDVKNDTVFINYLDGQQKFISQIEEYQKNNKGILKSMDFPLDFGEEKSREPITIKNSFYGERVSIEDLINGRKRGIITAIDLSDKEDVFSNNNKAEKETIGYLKGVKESQTVKKAPVYTFCKQMSNAIEQLALRSEYGHQKYLEFDEDYNNFARVPNANEEYSNAMFRHALNIGEDSELDHYIACAWDSIARLEIFLRKNLEN